jgi:hypothetical protein
MRCPRRPAADVGRFPAVNPISEGWFGKGTPIDHLGSGLSVEPCPVCEEPTVVDTYRAMLSRHVGVGLPFFLAPLAKRAATRGKFGEKSLWDQCQRCRSVLPRDEAAQAIADRFGRSEGFLNRPGTDRPDAGTS